MPQSWRGADMTTMIDVARNVASTRSVRSANAQQREQSAQRARNPSALCSRWQCFDLWIQTLSLRTQRDEAYEIEERPAWKHAAEVTIVWIGGAMADP